MSCCSSGFRKRRTCTSICCSTARAAWPSASRPSSTTPARSAAALAYIALADLDRVAVVAFAGDIVADFPLSRGKARILSLLKFLEGLQAAGSRDRPGPGGQRLRPSRPAAGAGARAQRPVRSQRLPARARPAAPSSLRAAHHSGLRPPAKPSPILKGDIELFDVEIGNGPESHRHRAQPAAVPPASSPTSGLGQPLLQHVRHRHTRSSTEVPFDELLLRMMRTAGAIA